MGQKKTGKQPEGKVTERPDTRGMSDSVAEALEAAGFYRRAARRWLEVLDQCRGCEERTWLAGRRRQCMEKIRKPELTAERFGEVCRAASDTQKRMGIRPQEMFKSYPSAGDAQKKSSC